MERKVEYRLMGMYTKNREREMTFTFAKKDKSSIFQKCMNPKICDYTYSLFVCIIQCLIRIFTVCLKNVFYKNLEKM